MRRSRRILHALALSLGALAGAAGQDIYVAANGAPGGSGAIGSPIDLATALGGSRAAPGDTIWVRGGTYVGAFASRLNGSASAPITVRAYPGERAIIDGNADAARASGTVIAVYGAHTVLRDLEVTSSDPARPDNGYTNVPQGVTIYDSQDISLIDLIVHDCPGQGIAAWSENTDALIYGCLVYYNGVNGTYDHGMYIQNRTGTKRIADNIVCHQASHNIHCYGSTAAYLDDLVLDGNTVFEAASLSGGSARNILLGGLTVAHDPVVTDNLTYLRGSDSNSNIGYSASATSALITGNYFIAGNVAIRLDVDATSTVSGNFFSGPTDPANMPSLYPANTYVASRPTSGQAVFVRPNHYESGRANITIYNWALAGSVSVDLGASGLSPGDGFEIRDAQNWFAAPVASGTWSGGPVAIPMTGLVTAVPVGAALIRPAHTAPQFGAFIVRRTSTASAVATPTIAPAGGSFSSPPTVTLACATAGAAIHYTLDGSDPGAAAPTYAAPFTLASSAVVKARAMTSGMADSAVASASFTISTSSGALFSDDFSSASPEPAWTFIGPSWSQSGGVLSQVSTAAADPKQAVLTDQAYPSDVEILARVRVDAWSAGDLARAGVGLCVDAGGHGYDLVFHGAQQVQFLDDGVRWGDAYPFAWQPGTWYWFRLKRQAGTLSGRIWADGSAEPTTWPYVQSGWSDRGGGAPSLDGGSAGAGLGASTASFDDVAVGAVTTGDEPLFGDDFSGAAIAASWSAHDGAWSQANGVVQQTSTAAGDPKKLVLGGTWPDDVEIVARVRVDAWTSGDAARAGVGLRTDAATGEGYDLVFHGSGQVQFLDDHVTWGNAYAFAWQPGAWYWFALKIESGTLYGKVWADGAPEPSTWPYAQGGWSDRAAGAPALNGGSAAAGQGSSTASFDDVSVCAPTPGGLARAGVRGDAAFAVAALTIGSTRAGGPR